MAEETLISAARRLVRFARIDLDKGGMLTLETQAALETLARHVEIADAHLAARSPGRQIDAVNRFLRPILAAQMDGNELLVACLLHAPSSGHFALISNAGHSDAESLAFMRAACARIERGEIAAAGPETLQ